MLRAALAYARQGWPVFPCRAGEKVPATRRGFLDACTDPDRITWWWTSVPDRNVGIATGEPGPDVVDVDVRAGGSGFAAFRRLRREGLAGQPSVIVRTPGGGMHAYYAGTGQRSGHLAGHYLDFRSQGGYVLAPPSVVGGRPYVTAGWRAGEVVFSWGRARDLLDPRPVPDLGASRGAGREADPGRLAAWVAVQPEGNRNAGLFWAASRVIEAGQADALDALAQAAQAAGLTGEEASRTVRSAQRRAARPAGHHAGARAEREQEATS
jgi:hypothetical protein